MSIIPAVKRLQFERMSYVMLRLYAVPSGNVPVYMILNVA
jgi:hypothetical protein